MHRILALNGGRPKVGARFQKLRADATVSNTNVRVVRPTADRTAMFIVSASSHDQPDDLKCCGFTWYLYLGSWELLPLSCAAVTPSLAPMLTST
jgi:hypothetical protein